MYKIKERLELLRGMLSLCENRTGVKLSILYNILKKHLIQKCARVHSERY